MRTCKRCGGSGWLFRPRDRVMPGKAKKLKDSFKRCTDCGGAGTKPRPRQ